jgi:multiple sugar transport system permease protein
LDKGFPKGQKEGYPMIRKGPRFEQGGALSVIVRNKFAYLLMFPSIILIASISFYPIFVAFLVSLHETEYLNMTRFVGLENFINILGNSDIYHNISVSLKYVIGSLIPCLLIGLILALILNQHLRLRGFFRTIIISPWAISQTITALLFAWLFNPHYGPITSILNTLFNSSYDLVNSPDTAMPILITANVWRSYPLATVLILAALQAIPVEMYEAAKIDGAPRIRILFNIIFPLIRSSLLITTILLTLEYFNMVTLIYVLTGGGPIGRTATLSFECFHAGFDTHRIAYGTTVGIIILIFNVIFTVFYIRVTRER